MPPRYKASEVGVELIERFEGFRARSARLDDGRWTIGFGHTRSAREGLEISREDAGMLLRWFDLPPVEAAINGLVTAELNQNQYDALVAFVFNVGVDAFRESDVLGRINEGRPTEAALALELWRKAEIGGDPVVLDALIRRRAAEKTLFLTPPDGFAPTPSPLVRPEHDARAARALPTARPAEIEAPLSGDRAEVRLVEPYDIEPSEAPTAFAPPSETSTAFAAQPAPEPRPIVIETVEAPAEEAVPTAFAADHAPTVEALSEETPTAFTAEPALEPVEHVQPDETPTAFEPKPAAEPQEVWPVAAEAFPEETPTAFTVEPEPAAEETPVAAAEETPTAFAPEPETAAEPSPEAPAALEPPAVVTARWTVEVEAEWEGPAASSWIVGTWPTPTPTAFTLDPETTAEPEPAEETPTAFTVEPEADPEAAVDAPAEETPAAFEVEPQAESEPAPAAAAPEPSPAPVPAEPPAAQERKRAVPEAAMRERPLYSSYGPMAAAVRPTTPQTPIIPQPRPAAPAPEPEPEPVVTAAAPAPISEPLTLTSPPSDLDEPRPALTVPAGVAQVADELETPLFDEGWDAPGALSGRVARHEPIAEPEPHNATGVGKTGPFLLLGLMGFIAFGAAVFAFSRGAAAGNQTMLAWALAVIGALCVGASVYFLLRRLGGPED
jgi:lysozyme